MKILKKEWVPYVFLFLFFFLLSTWMPISGDDWNNYLVGSQGIRHMVGQAIGMYFDWEGRFVSRLLINFLTYYKFLFNFLFAFLVSVSVYFINHLGKKRNSKLFFLGSIFLFLFLENTLFTQTMLWVAGSITYFFSTALLLGYLFLSFHFLEGKSSYSKWIFLGCGFFSFCLSMFVENIAFANVVLNLCLLLYERIRYQRWNRLFLFTFLCSFLGAFLMLVSPGSQKRMMVEMADNSMSFWDTITFHFHAFFFYTISNHWYLILLQFFASFLLFRRLEKKRLYQFFVFLFYLIGPLLWIYETVVSSFFLTDFYWLLSLSSSVFLVCYSYRNNIDKLKYHVLYYVVAFASQLILVVTPAITSRTSLLCVILLGISYLYIIDDLMLFKMPKFIYYIGYGILCSICCFFLVAYYNMSQFQQFLSKQIQQDVLEQKPEVVVYESPSYLSWGLLPTGEYHTRTFKAYYGISETQNLVLVKSVWDYGILFRPSKTLDRNR